MKNLLKKFRILLIAPFVLVLFSFAHSVQAADIYWYSTGNTAWASSTNWYSDVDHTIQAGALPTENDNAYLLGAVSPILDLDVSSLAPQMIDSSGLTGDANTTGIIVTSLRGNYLSSQIQGNATFNQNSFSSGVIVGRAEFNDNSYPGNDIYGSPVIFNDNSRNSSYIGGDATFNDNSYNASYIDGSAVFNGHSYNYYSTVAVDATFNDYAYDYNGSYGGQTNFNNTVTFTFNNENGSGNGDWGNSVNWVDGNIPGPNDDAIITSCVILNTGDEFNNVSVRSATFTNNSCWNTGGTLTATNGIFFDLASTNNSYLVGNVIFNLNSQNYGTVTGTSTFLNSSYNAGNIEGNQAVFVDNSVTEGSVYVPVDFISSTNAGYVSVDANFYGYSYNNSDVGSNSIFGFQSSNNGQLEGSGTFYDGSINNGNIFGSTALFVGDSSNNTVQIDATLVRKYISDTTTSRDLTAGGYWTVIADNAVVDVTNATFNIHTTFQTLGTGSFIGAGGFPGVTINSPTSGSTVTTWSPSVAWHTSFNDYVTCQYSFNTINWFGASCAGNGSDLVATTTYGSQTLTVRATDSQAVATTSAVTYNYTPARLLYFYNSGSDTNWTTVGNWYTNSSHTVAAGSVPTSIDNVTVVGSTVPSVNLDTWIQPSSIYTQIGIVFTSASSASTTATTTGRATFNNTAQNNATIYGNVTFNNTSSNADNGRIVGNASFNATTTNTGTVVLNATFYGDTASNTGTISGVKTRYYTATTTTTKNFTSGWTVVADGVTVTVSGSTYDGTTKFKTLNNGYFIGGPTAVYWSSNVPNGSWTTTTNWYSDSTATVHINRVASSTETVITVGSYGPLVDLDNVNWVAPTGIDASQTGITFTSASNAVLDTSITGTTTFTGTVRNTSTILGDVTFASTTRNDSGAVISGNVTFNNTSINNGGLITGDVTFNNTSINTNNSVIYGDATFNSSAVNGTTTGAISGTSYFNSTSRNDGTITNDAYFYGDSTNNNGTVSGTQKRYYTANATTTRNFVTTGPWTVVADGAIIHLGDTATFNATTTFTEINGGNFTGEGVPGSYTTCTKALVLAGTYTFTGDVTNTCDVQTDDVTINGGGYTLGPPPPQPFPDNKSSSGWIDMTGNFLLYHMNESSGNITDSSGDNRTGTVNGTMGYAANGNVGNALNFSGDDYITVSNFPNIYLNPFSVSLWIYHDTLPNDNVFMSQHQAGHTSWLFVEQVYSCGRHFVFQVTEWYGTRSNCTTISTGTWYNLVATWDGVQTGRLYLNGQLIETATGMVNFSDATNNQMWISGSQAGGTKHIGKMDELAMWSRKLSDAEALSIYNNQSSGGGSLITTHNHSFSLSNLNLSGSTITSVGATINLTGVTTTVAFDVSGADAAGNAQNGGTIIGTNSSLHGTLTANGGNSTDYGYGGAAGTITLTNTSYGGTSKVAGSNGPNLGAGQSSGSSGSTVLGCTDPNATNYNASATVYNGSCTYSNTVVRGCTVPSATNYNSNAIVNDGSCTYPSYNTTNPNPSSNNGGGSNSNNNNNNSTPPPAFQGGIAGSALSPAMLSQLLLQGINGITTPVINGVGVTKFGDVLTGLQPLGNLHLSNISIDFVPQISSFLFAPLPDSILSVLNKSPKLLGLFASVGVSKEQDLVALQRNPILLPKIDLPPGLYTVTASSTRLDTYLAADDTHKLVELVRVRPGTVINVSLVPLSKGKVFGLFLGDTITFFESSKSEAYVVIESPQTPGRYILTTKSSPIPLAIEVVAPPVQTPVKKLSLKDKILKWFSTLFH
jgi:hypothetical protein